MSVDRQPAAGRTAAPIHADFATTSAPRAAEPADLAAINALIAAAMDTWGLSERVKRLSLPLYQYDAQDLGHFDMFVVETGDGAIVGVAAMEAADAAECPQGRRLALLHGLYVDPRRHAEGIGSRLLHHVQSLAETKLYDGLLVKANPAAISFFQARGFALQAIDDPTVDYPYRYVKSLAPGADPGRLAG